MLTFEEWRHTYADVFETDDDARAAWTAASNNGYRAGAQDTQALLTAHSSGAREPVAWQSINAPQFVTSDPKQASQWICSGYELRPLYAHPQPMPQTDAARDAKRYQAIRSQVLPFNAYASGNPNWTFPGYGPRGATFDEAIDAEIERLDRAKEPK